MKVPVKLQREIIDFLKSLPNLDDTESQRAFIYQTGFDKELQEHIPFGKPLGQFVPLLVSILIKYGRLDNGQTALEAILETAQNYVGQDKKDYCGTLIKGLQKMQDEVISPPILSNFFYKRIWYVSAAILCILILGLWWYTQNRKPSILDNKTFDKNSVPITTQEWVDPVSGIELVWIPEGCYYMGQSEVEKSFLLQNVNEGIYNEWYARELPRHEVCLKGFWIGKYEVTQEQWQRIMGENPSYFTKEKIGYDTSKHPVEQISWEKAQKFIDELNKKAKNYSFRLPSEAEWEYVARSGTNTIFFWGDNSKQISQYTWYSGNSDKQTHPVGRLDPNAWGLYDIYGNVMEWCVDSYHSHYDSAPIDGSPWELEGYGNSRIERGCSFSSIFLACRSAARFWDYQNIGQNIEGVRLVLDFASGTSLPFSNATSLKMADF